MLKRGKQRTQGGAESEVTEQSQPKLLANGNFTGRFGHTSIKPKQPSWLIWPTWLSGRGSNNYK